VLPDVVVVGGGVVGCSCAYYLSREGLNVQLIERGALGSGTSKAPQCHTPSWELPEINLRLTRASSRLYQTLSEELPIDIEYERTGSLMLVDKPESLPSFLQTVGLLKAWGLVCRLLDADELSGLEPNLAPHVAGGAFFSEDARVNPLLVTLGLAAGARNQGALIQTFTKVTGIRLAASKRAVVAVDTTQGTIPTKYIVNCAGVWSREVAHMVGLDIPVLPRKGYLVVTEPVADNVINCKIILAAGYVDSLKAGAELALAANVQQTRSGNLVLGSSRQFVGFDWSIDPQVVCAMIARCLRLFPVLSGIHAIRCWAGLRPHTPDLVPIIGGVDTIEGLYLATGHEGLGITLAPITGKLISQMITGREAEFSVEELSLSRFAVDCSLSDRRTRL